MREALTRRRGDAYTHNSHSYLYCHREWVLGCSSVKWDSKF